MQNTSARILEIKIHVISLQIKAHFTCILENVSTMNNWWPLVAHHIHFQRSYCELWASCCKLAHWQAPLACQWVLRGSQSNCMTYQTVRKTWVRSGAQREQQRKQTRSARYIYSVFRVVPLCSQCEVIELQINLVLLIPPLTISQVSATNQIISESISADLSGLHVHLHALENCCSFARGIQGPVPAGWTEQQKKEPSNTSKIEPYNSMSVAADSI